MTSYPVSPRSAFLQWCQTHQNIFTALAANIGLTPGQAADFAGAAAAAFAAQLAQEEALQAYRAATETVNATFSTLRERTGATVKLIRAFADASADPTAVYTTAQVQPPAPPQPLPPPTRPTNLSIRLDPSGGALTLRWKATNPPGAVGTSYLIRRKLPGNPAFRFLGVSGKKEFVDSSLPAGSDGVQYTVQGQRGDASGPLSPILTVRFGSGGASVQRTPYARTYETAASA